MNYFTGCKDEESRKKRFKQLAKKHHPDKGGDPEIFKEINRQYNEEHSQFHTGFQYYGFWEAANDYQKLRNQREEILRKEQEELDKFFKDRSRPKADHGTNYILANSKDIIRMTSFDGDAHEYTYNVFSDIWERKRD